MKIDADAGGSVGKIWEFRLRLARIYELYASRKSNSFSYEARSNPSPSNRSSTLSTWNQTNPTLLPTRSVSVTTTWSPASSYSCPNTTRTQTGISRKKQSPSRLPLQNTERISNSSLLREMGLLRYGQALDWSGKWRLMWVPVGSLRFNIWPFQRDLLLRVPTECTDSLVK